MRRLSIIFVVLVSSGLFAPALAQNAGGRRPGAGGMPPASVGQLPGLPGQADSEPAGRPNPAATRVSMSFDKADVISVVKFISTASGVPIVCDPALTGNVTIVSQKEIPLADAYEVVNAALRVRGYLMVGTFEDKVIRVVPLKKAVSDQAVVQEGKDPGSIVPSDNMVTQVMPLEYISALKLKDDLKPLIDEAQASCVAITTTNTLIVTDNAGNIRRIAEIVKALDKDTSDVIEVEVYQCKHSSADSLAETLTQIYQLKPAGAPGQQQQQQRGQEGQQQQVKSDDGIITLKGEIRLAPDTRTNSLIISSSREKIKLVLDTLKKLDVDTEPEVKAKVFALQYADANMVATQLNNLFEQPQGGADTSGGRRNPWDFWYGGGRGQGTPTGYAGLKRNVIVADIRTNSVIVTATEQNMKAFEDMIRELDAPRVISDITRIFSLKYAAAVDLADSLNRLFRGEYRRTGSFFDFMMGNQSRDEGGPLDQLRNITVVAEEKTNSLLVTGPAQVFGAIEKIIEQLDRRTAQVYIEVAIVDVTLDDSTKFGIEWTWSSKETAPDGTPEQTGSTGFKLSDITTGLKYSVISDNLKGLLQALQTRSNVKVYSTPRITTADNVEATISIGKEVPYISSSQDTNAGNVLRSVEFKPVNVSLVVTPHVNETTDVIALDVLQTIDEIIGNEPEMNAPIIASRRAETSILVKDGQTIVIGGIIKENRQRVTTAVPIISQIPLIGELFKSRDWKNEKSELMVFLTPHILVDDDAISVLTEETRNELTNKPKVDEKEFSAPKE
ncbi:MAG: hypothetical protein KBC96_01195 [Armatimonadetes bacterium]|nr:hypothetical protein [Armatimonadota bacterium]